MAKNSTHTVYFTDGVPSTKTGPTKGSSHMQAKASAARATQKSRQASVRKQTIKNQGNNAPRFPTP